MKVKINKEANLLVNKLYPNDEFKKWFLNLLELFPSDPETQFVQVSSTYMKNRKRDYEKDIQELLSSKIIRTNGRYRVADYAKGYRLDTLQTIKTKELVEIEVNDKYFHLLKDELSKNVTTTLNRLELDPEIEKLLSSAKLIRQFGKGYIDKISEPLNKIVNKMNTNNSKTKSNRLINNFARMKSELRYYFKLDGERLVEVDATNSQLFFLVILISRTNKSVLDNKDADLFKQLSIKGEIYEYIEGVYKKIYKNTDADRSIIKMSILQSLFSKETDKNGKKTSFRRNTRAVFQKEFPSIYNFMVNYKRKYHSALANDLQKIESEFIEELNKMMNDFLPVYDCVYVKESDIMILKSYLTKIFHNRYGLIPKFKYKTTKQTSVNKFIKSKKAKQQLKTKLNNVWY